MKKIIFALMAVAVSFATYAANVSVRLINDKTIEGKLISYSDTSLVMEPIFYHKKQQIELKPEIVRYFNISGVGNFSVRDGKFVPSKQTQAKMEKKQINLESPLAANPNEVIAKALKSTGATAIGFGIPSLIAGTFLIAYGKIGIINIPKTPAEVNTNDTKAKCATAGFVLMPFGAALTIVGIPLYVHGKRIAELNFNYTGNGAGVAVNF